MDSSPLVSAHVVVRELGHFVGSTLRSLAAQTHTPLQVVLVDNASQEREIPWPRSQGPEIMVLRNFRDQGFSRAHNQALSSLYTRWPETVWDQRYVALISSRVALAPDALQTLVRVLEEDPACMVVAPKVRRATQQAGEDAEEVDLVDTGVLEQAGVEISSALECVSRGRGCEDTASYHEGSSSLLSGTFCVLVRASVLMRAKVGEEWLDADLPESYAMADLVWRFQLLRMPMRYVPQALAWVQTTTYKPVGIIARVRRWYGSEALHVRSARSYACVLRAKNASWGRLFFALPHLLLIWFLRFFQAILDPRMIPLMAKSWGVLPRALKKRRFLQLAISQSHR